MIKLTPTIEQLDELGFSKLEKCYILETLEEDWIQIWYTIEKNRFELETHDGPYDSEVFTDFYPEYIEDLQTIIRCFRIK